MCAEIRYNPLNVGNCAQKCGKFPRKGRALCGKMREHPSFPQQNVRKNAGIPRSPAMNYAQKCGKNCFFVKTGGSVIGQ